MRVRRAFAQAIDKQLIVQKITRAGELPATSFVPPGLLMAMFRPPPLLMTWPPRKTPHREPAFPEAILSLHQLPLQRKRIQNETIAVEPESTGRKNLDVELNLARQEWKVYLNSLNSLDYGIASFQLGGDYPDPNTFLDMFVTGNGNNRTGWSDPTYDRLIAEAARETDPARRFEILKQAENILINEQVPVCPLYYFVGIQLFDPAKWGGIEPNVLDDHLL